LAVTRNPRGHGLYERIALAEDLQERLDLLGLQRAVEINFAFNLAFSMRVAWRCSGASLLSRARIWPAVSGAAPANSVAAWLTIENSASDTKNNCCVIDDS